jgi:hypothetical protein
VVAAKAVCFSSFSERAFSILVVFFIVVVDAVFVATFLAWAGLTRKSRKQTKRVERREARWVVIFLVSLWCFFLLETVRGCVWKSGARYGQWMDLDGWTVVGGAVGWALGVQGFFYF